MDTEILSDEILELRDLIAGYGRTTILNGTSFGVKRAAITTIIGPNGAGKSTVFKSIFGMLQVRSGSIRFEGRDVTNWQPARLLDAGICFVPQGRNIFPELSVQHNLELGAVTLKQGPELNGRMQKVLERFPVLREKSFAQASTLSGGQQKILEIGRALLMRPKLLLIDEPSIGLSPKMVQDVFDILTELANSGVSVLMVEQNARSALEVSQYAIVLELGQTRRCDAAATILADPNIGALFLGGASTV